jgi:hypothetical protein
MSSVTYQPSYEMFGNRSIPFQGDYNWIALAFDGDSCSATPPGPTTGTCGLGVDIRRKPITSTGST